MRLEVGGLAVYPAHGVGRIEALEDRGDGGQVLVMRILENGMQITIPASNVGEIGLRPVIKKSAVKEVYKVLKSAVKPARQTNWNRRYRDYMDKIKTGSPFDEAAVLGELLAMRAEKDLAFGERKLLDLVRTLLVKELALAAGQSEGEVLAEINGFFPPSKGSSVAL